MTRRIDALDIASLTILAGSFALTAAVFADLPAQIPIHFDARGMANGWASREVGAWLLPIIGGAIWAFTRATKYLVPQSRRAQVAAAPIAALALVVASMMTAVQIFVLFAATHSGQSIGRPLAIALGAMWLALGQIMPRLRRNPIIGVRTAWTLTSDENWLRTHRVAAYSFGGAGLFALIAGIVGGSAASPLALGAIVASGLVPVLYSYFLARRLPPER